MGAITNRADGRFMATVNIGGGNRQSVYGATRKEVADKVRDLEDRMQQGVNIAASTRTLASFLTQWLEDVVQQRNKDGTYDLYHCIVTAHLVPALGTIKLCDLTTAPIQLLCNRVAKERKPRTVRNVRAVLRQALNRALRERLIAYNPATLVEIPKIEHNEPRILTVQEARAFLAAIKGDRYEVAYLVALYTGMREGELLGLMWGNVDFEASTIRVTGSLHKGKRDTTKSKAGVRTIIMPATVRIALEAHRTAQDARNTRPRAFVFTTSNDTPINRHNFYRDFRAFLKRHNLPKIRFHDLRHSCATLMLSAGESPKVVQAQLGHAHITTTLGIYAHVLRDDQERASNRLAGLLEESVVKPLSNANETP